MYNDTFEAAQANWNVQCMGSQNQSNYTSVTWVGIGGVINTSNIILQTGTGFWSGAQHPWYDLDASNTGAYVDYNATLSCTTSIYAEVYYQSNEWCSWVYWGSAGLGSCDTVTPDQSVAEVIDERPICYGDYSWLADYNYTDFSNAGAESVVRGWHTPAGYANNQIFMYDYGASGRELADPGALQSPGNIFRDNWVFEGSDGVNC